MNTQNPSTVHYGLDALNKTSHGKHANIIHKGANLYPIPRIDFKAFVAEASQSAALITIFVIVAVVVMIAAAVVASNRREMRRIKQEDQEQGNIELDQLDEFEEDDDSIYKPSALLDPACFEIGDDIESNRPY